MLSQRKKGQPLAPTEQSSARAGTFRVTLFPRVLGPPLDGFIPWISMPGFSVAAVAILCSYAFRFLVTPLSLTKRSLRRRQGRLLQVKSGFSITTISLLPAAQRRLCSLPA